MPHKEEHPEHDRFITVWACIFVHNHAQTRVQACTSRANLAIMIHNALPEPLILPLMVILEQSQATDSQVKRCDSHSSDWCRKRW